MSVSPNWIAVDWGTSNVRVWAMNAEGTVLAEAGSDQGMSRLSPDQFEGALRDLMSDWSLPAPCPVIACGMVGAKQGWAEAPYAFVPCAPQSAMIKAPAGPDLSVHIIGGVAQKSAPDVMRGEETQIAGFLALNPKFDGVICLPGTHTKWVHISAGEIVSFQTCLTGEMFGLLSKQSVLRHSVGKGWDADEFANAVETTLSNPASIMAKLFSIRAAGLVDTLSTDAATARLSGLLIGAELAAAKPYWLGQQVALLGAEPLVGHYKTALTAQGVPVIETDAPRMTLEGLKAARAQQGSQT